MCRVWTRWPSSLARLVCLVTLNDLDGDLVSNLQRVLKPLDLFVRVIDSPNAHPQFFAARATAGVFRAQPAQYGGKDPAPLDSSSTARLTAHEDIKDDHAAFLWDIAPPNDL
jgi:hypothetical protein